jgi:hypothetical protein
MRSSVATVVAVAAAVLLAACSNDTMPTRIVGPSARSADVIPSTCDITNITQAGKAYFTSSKDPVFNVISTLKADLRNFGVGTQTTADVFAILKRVATVRLTNAADGAATGGAFVDDVLACASFPPLGIPSNFNAAGALGSGIFAVSPSGVVQAFAGSSGGVPVAASPRWGAEPGSANNWPGGSYLVYGYLTGTDATGGFELGTLPQGVINAGTTASNPIKVGVCSATTVVDNNGKPTAANLLVHNGNEILPLVNLAFCSQTASFNTATSWYTRLASNVRSYFSPTTAWAQDGGDLFIGGLPSGWSPFQPKLFAASDDTLSFAQQPVNTMISSPPITVQVKAVSGSSLPPLNVRLTIAGNHGTPAFLTQGGISTDHLDATTDATGMATFTFGFTKAGGYTLTATGYLGGNGGVVGTSPVNSVLFNVQNK